MELYRDMLCRILETEEFEILLPKWNPQTEFTSAEEKPRFQGFAEQILHEEIGLYSSVLTRQNPIGALPPASGFAAMDFDEGCRR